MDAFIYGLALGLGATLVFDLWGLLVHRLYGVAGLDYRFVGRWLLHMPAGKLAHAPIFKAEPKSFEAPLGWAMHYVIGMGFGLILLGLDPDYAKAPQIGPAIWVGLMTVGFPFLVMQPAFGMGVAAHNLPNRWQARGRSLLNHMVFGLGLYLTALGLRLVL